MSDPFTDYEKHWPSDGALKAIGLLFVISGTAEKALTFQLLRVMSHPDPPQARNLMAIQGLDVSVTLGVMRAYVKRCGLQKTGLLELIEDVQSAFQKRNLFAHAVVSRAERENVVEVKATKPDKNGKLPQAQRFKAEEILEFAKAIHASAKALDLKFVELGFFSFKNDVSF
ncbi:hypothetical protein [Ensifer aridi]|uniref:hypothetical protein n=1 Tax=Ensifer aridi TaxID=1708715 RepID=UPI000A105AC9|nr:hypothetical protein [Ensifer aridi]